MKIGNSPDNNSRRETSIEKVDSQDIKYQLMLHEILWWFPKDQIVPSQNLTFQTLPRLFLGSH
jgi:hypothetical protein